MHSWEKINNDQNITIRAAREVSDFLSYLATERNVAAATQNQAQYTQQPEGGVCPTL